MIPSIMFGIFTLILKYINHKLTMKKLFTLSMLSFLFIMKSNAQCSPDFSNTVLGLSPLGDSIPCASAGNAYDQTIQIYAPDSVYITSLSTTVRVYSIRVDSISNLPCGIGYGFDRADRTYVTTPTVPARGCMKISGTTSDPAGQYKLKIAVTISTSLISGTYPDASLIPGLGSAFEVFFRVGASSSTCAPIDTSRTAVNKTSSCRTNDFTGIAKVTNAFTSFEIAPNPVTEHSVVTFSSDNNGSYETIITNTIGEIMSSEKVEVNAGDNQVNLNTKSLNNGIYFFTIKDGKNSMTKKFILNK